MRSAMTIPLCWRSGRPMKGRALHGVDVMLGVVPCSETIRANIFSVKGLLQQASIGVKETLTPLDRCNTTNAADRRPAPQTKNGQMGHDA